MSRQTPSEKGLGWPREMILSPYKTLGQKDMPVIGTIVMRRRRGLHPARGRRTGLLPAGLRLLRQESFRQGIATGEMLQRGIRCSEDESGGRPLLVVGAEFGQDVEVLERGHVALDLAAGG
jgi:hypothetical protein